MGLQLLFQGLLDLNQVVFSRCLSLITETLPEVDLVYLLVELHAVLNDRIVAAGCCHRVFLHDSLIDLILIHFAFDFDKLLEEVFVLALLLLLLLVRLTFLCLRLFTCFVLFDDLIQTLSFWLFNVCLVV